MKKASNLVGLLLVLTIIAGSFSGIAAFAADTNSNFSIVKGVLTKQIQRKILQNHCFCFLQVFSFAQQLPLLV